MTDQPRLVFVEETSAESYVKLIANGEIDEQLLEALEGFIARKRKRILQTEDRGAICTLGGVTSGS